MSSEETVDAVVEDVLREVSRSARPGPVLKGYELPADTALAVPQVTVALPVGWMWRGTVVEEEHLPEIAAALESRLRARVAVNQAYAGAIERPLLVRRAGWREKAWSAARPTVGVGDPPLDRPALDPKSTVRVRIDGNTHTLGASRTRKRVVLGNDTILIALEGDELVVVPEGLVVQVGGTLARSTIAVTGPFRVLEAPGWLGWGKPGRVLAAGEVLDRVGPPPPAPRRPLACRLWGDGIDLALDPSRPSTRVEHGDVGVEFRLDPDRGVLALRAVGGPATGRGDLGRIVLDPMVEAEVLPGEVEQISIGGMLVSLAMTGASGMRGRRIVTVGPERAIGSALFSDAILVPDPNTSSIRHVGELYAREGVRSLFKALRRGRVDGRAADMGDVLPVDSEFSLQLGASSLFVRV